MTGWGQTGREGQRPHWWIGVLALVSVGLVVGSAAALAQKRVPVRKPDLVVRSVSRPPASIPPGSTFTSAFSIGNDGRLKAGRSSVREYLSRNARKDGRDVALSGS